jgi:hypothetical protein
MGVGTKITVVAKNMGSIDLAAVQGVKNFHAK